MKLGGLTWWRNNYGSILQAYALQEQLNGIEGVDYEIICQYGKKVASVSNLKEKLKRLGLAKTAKRVFWKFGLKKLRKRNENIQHFMDEHLRTSAVEYSEETIAQANRVYDGFVCGSDQVWNPELVDVTSMYWLNFAESGKRKIAYAPSIGVDRFTDAQAEIVRANLADFTAISSREESGTALIDRTIGEGSCQTVLDPTLMVDRKMWDDLCAERRYNEPYIFVYMLRGTKKQRKLVEAFAKRKNLKIVTMPFLDSERIELYDFTYGDIKLWDADPADFISVIRNAEYVFTDSFHSMVFSCLYHREFFTFPKIGKAQLNRVTGLQALFEIPSRMITEETTLEAIEAMPPIDWERVECILSEQRRQSQDYLKQALE